MLVELTFILQLWSSDGSDRVTKEIYPRNLSPRMLEIVERIIYPYSLLHYILDDNKLFVYTDYTHDTTDRDIQTAFNDWIYGISVDGNAPDLWMEADLSLEGYSEDVEFVPTLISFRIY